MGKAGGTSDGRQAHARGGRVQDGRAPSSMSRTRATLFVLAAGALWGCISLFVRLFGAAGVSSVDVMGIRMAVGTVGMLVVLLARDRRLFRVRLRDLWLFAGTGIVSITLFNVCYFTCMTMSEASVAVVLLYTSPIFVMVMSAVFFRERVTRRKALAVALTFAGCVAVTGLLGGAAPLSPTALALGVASGFFYATYSIFGRVALARYDTLTITFYTFLAGLVAALVLGDAAGTARALSADPLLLAGALGLGVLCTIVPYLLYTAGLAHLEPSRAAVFATVEPVVGGLLGIFAYGEGAGPVKLLGMALIIAAVVLANTEDEGSGDA